MPMSRTAAPIAAAAAAARMPHMLHATAPAPFTTAAANAELPPPSLSCDARERKGNMLRTPGQPVPCEPQPGQRGAAGQ